LRSPAHVTTGAGYRLDLDAEDVDVELFARLLGEGRGALDAGRAAEAVEMLGEALSLWRGPPLVEVADMSFARREIARLEEMRLTALETRADANMCMGAPELAIGELEALLSQHPAREGLAARLMTALYRAGRQADALAVFHGTRARLVDELGLEPGPELRELQGRILRHDPALVPESTAPARGGATGVDLTSHPAIAGDPRLPEPPNTTVGRDADVAAIVGRLRDERCRLVTLTGPGGVGKTRVALEASRSAAGAFADGAWFVSLADVRRADDVAATIVHALAIVLLTGESHESAVMRFLAAKDVLLVLDNLEQVLPAASLIARLLETTTRLTVLATSREPLRLRAEECHPIAPLGLPSCEASNDPDRMRHIDAVALFCDRARARTPSFVLDAHNAAAVAEICRRVDGLPLALELAAARCGLLSPREIADRLGAELGDLGSGPSDAPARQRTLRETIDWSHALLADEEQTTFARFAVFVGGATVDAAETVTGSSLDALDSLVAKSLLIRRGNSRGSSRLHTLETTHAYARERLAAAPDRHAVHERHHRFFADLAREHGSEQSLMSAGRADHLAQLDAESDNLDAALAWALREGHARRALELCNALGTYWVMRYRGDRISPAIEEALQLPGSEGCVEARIGALLALTWCLRPTQRSTAAAVEAEALARDLGDPLLLARALEARADVEVDRGRIDIADVDECPGQRWVSRLGNRRPRRRRRRAARGARAEPAARRPADRGRDDGLSRIARRRPWRHSPRGASRGRCRCTRRDGSSRHRHAQACRAGPRRRPSPCGARTLGRGCARGRRIEFRGGNRLRTEGVARELIAVYTGTARQQRRACRRLAPWHDGAFCVSTIAAPR
jgi:predicted ATPase